MKSLSIFVNVGLILSLVLSSVLFAHVRVTSAPSWNVGIQLNVEGHPSLSKVVHRAFKNKRLFEFYQSEVLFLRAYQERRFGETLDLVLAGLKGDLLAKLTVEKVLGDLQFSFKDAQGNEVARAESFSSKDFLFRVVTLDGLPILALSEVFVRDDGSPVPSTVRSWEIDHLHPGYQVGNLTSDQIELLTIAFLASHTRTLKLPGAGKIVGGALLAGGLLALGYKMLPSGSAPPTAPTSPLPSGGSINPRAGSSKFRGSSGPYYSDPYQPSRPSANPHPFNFFKSSQWGNSPPSPQGETADSTTTGYRAPDYHRMPVHWTRLSSWAHPAHDHYGHTSYAVVPNKDPHISGDFRSDKEIYKMVVPEDTGKIFQGVTNDPGDHSPQEHHAWVAPTRFAPVTQSQRDELAKLDPGEFPDRNPYPNEVHLYDEMILESEKWIVSSQTMQRNTIAQQLNFMRKVFNRRVQFIRAARGREFNQFQRHFSLHDSGRKGGYFSRGDSEGAFHIELAAEQKNGFENGLGHPRGHLTMRRRLNSFHNYAVATYLKAKRDGKLYKFFSTNFNDAAKCEHARQEKFEEYYEDKLEKAKNEQEYMDFLWEEIQDTATEKGVEVDRATAEVRIKQQMGKKMFYNNKVFDQEMFDKVIERGQLLMVID